jgi:hypothetical protein
MIDSKTFFCDHCQTRQKLDDEMLYRTRLLDLSQKATYISLVLGQREQLAKRP